MATFQKFNCFAADVANGKHNLGANALKVLLTNTAPVAATSAVKADLTELGAGNGYTTGGAAVTVTSSAQTGGVYKLVVSDVTITASGGAIGPFRYAVLYNSTTAGGPLIGFWDYGAGGMTLSDGDAVLVKLTQADNIISLT